MSTIPSQTEAERKRMYAEAALAYSRRLTTEQIMEAPKQGHQRKITLESLDLVHARRPDVQFFNELLVQYPDPEGVRKKPRQVVPDNMVVVWPEPIELNGSFNVAEQPTGPLWVIEYVSKHNERKDYEENMLRYERELKVPYYLLFYPDNQEMTLYRLDGDHYVTVVPDEQGRCAIPPLELEIGLLDGWVRYWFRGELLPLPADLQRELDETRKQLADAAQRAEQEAQRAEQEAQRARAAELEVEKLRAELARLRQGEQGS